MRTHVLLYINGTRHLIEGEAVFQPLTDFLRYTLCKTGTKVVCAEGDCGACTVLLGKPDPEGSRLHYQAVNACIQYLYQLDCTHIITIEGVRNENTLNPVQQAMMACHGAQCGYCTPGIVMAMSQHFFGKKDTGHLEPATPQDIRNALTGNLCRCTGYDAILEAGCRVNPGEFSALTDLYPPDPMLGDFQSVRQETVQVASNGRSVFLPATLSEALQIKARYPEATVVSGGTDIHVVCNKRFVEPAIILSLAGITEPRPIRLENRTITVNSRATLAELEAFIAEIIPEFSRILHVFGSPQIKEAGTLAGNIANGSPIADTLPFLFVMEADIELSSSEKSRWVNINQFYTGYKTTVMKPNELITAVCFPIPRADEHLKLYKISKRTHLDISTFTAAIRMTCTNGTIQQASLAYGGVGPTVLRLPKTEQFLQGKPFELSTLQQAAYLAGEEISPLSDVRGSRDYRMQLAHNILLKFYYETAGTDKAVYA